MARSLLFTSLILSLAATTYGQATCDEGGSCAANQEDVTNLMQVQSQISRHGRVETEDQLEAWEVKESKDDSEVDIKELALHKDFLIIARKMAGQHVSEEEMDDFFSRSKMFFKEPLSEERGAEYCWKRTEPRGVGSVPKACPTGTEKGQFASWLPICYKKEGQTLKPCPAGWRNDGLYCRLPEYGRGIGHFTESGCKDSELAKKTGKGCHKPASSPLIWYPVCKANYDNFGCCICRPTTVTDESCIKEFGAKSHRIAGSSCYRTIDWETLKPHYAECSKEEPDLNAGLCYKACSDSSFKGVGPVCWEQASSNAVSCGMGLAKTEKVCSDATADQVFGVAKLTLNLATLGGAGPAVAAVTKTVETVEVAYATLSDAIGQIDEVAAGKKVDAAVAVDMVTRLDLGKTYLGGLKEIAEAESAADAIRGAAKFGAQFDPTGVAQVVGAFTYDKCPGKTGLKR